RVQEIANAGKGLIGHVAVLVAFYRDLGELLPGGAIHLHMSPGPYGKAYGTVGQSSLSLPVSKAILGITISRNFPSSPAFAIIDFPSLINCSGRARLWPSIRYGLRILAPF
ncbi:MAG: hypothetical protein Q7O66_12070, partial [Dehalococcoidia bacterium]|nr:hypothetical protein [Dehalococcoidia bacterium]